ncbi:MAG: OmpH family outer membrane protein [Bacteroidales bacterium]|nr:OmpH family outer membrane protein [Bacteroidales bacterium]MBN2758376.1 OmpH family outer membrane protein [Bacteroidales bacterium]
MKKLIITIFIFLFTAQFGFAQRFAYVDSEYILNKIPAYKEALAKLDLLSEQWEKELKAKYDMVELKYKEFQNEKVLLSQEMRIKKEEEIVQLEKEANDLKKKYFGFEGELFKKREEFIKPIQEEIYNAILKLAEEGNYAIIFDSASGATMLYTDQKYDKSDEVLKELGY